MAVWVADVSKWEGSNLSIARLKQAGIGAVIVKCGGGDVGIYTDSQWENNYAKCKAASMPTGAYWYLGATTVARAKEEAAYCLKLLKGKQFEYPVYVDVEEREHQLMSVNEPGTLAKVICAFTDALEAAGYYVGVYSWKWLLEPCGSKVAALDWWVCAWTKTKPCDCGMWQFGGEINRLRSTTVAGYKNMDQSYAYRDYPSIIKAAGLNGYTKSSSDNKDKQADDASPSNAIGFNTTKKITFKVATNVRDKPSIRDGNVVARYESGSSCVLESLVLSEGRVWGTYIGATSGKRRYVSLGTIERVEPIN